MGRRYREPTTTDVCQVAPAAILDRLLYHGTVLTIHGPSYRMRHHHRVADGQRLLLFDPLAVPDERLALVRECEPVIVLT